MRGRRLEPVYRVMCNGDRDGCAFSRETSHKDRARVYGEDHALSMRHEVVIQNVNDGLVLDGRVK